MNQKSISVRAAVRRFLAISLFVALQWLAHGDLHGQIFPNGGFDDGTSSGWLSWPAGATVQSGDKRDGTHAAQLVSSGTAVAERELNLLPGLTATISGYMKATSLAGTNRKARIDLVLLNAANQERITLVGQQTATSPIYKLYTVNEWIPLGTKSAKLRLTVSGTSTAFFDSFFVQYTTGKQLILNRNFAESFPTVPGCWNKTGGGWFSPTDGRPGSANTGAGAVTPGTGTHHISQDFPVAGGQTITIRGFIKTVNMGAFAGKLEVWCLKDNNTGTVVPTGIFQIASQNGTVNYGGSPFQATIVAPEGTVKAQLRLVGVGGTGCVGTVFFDDLSVIEGDGTVKAFPGAEGFGANSVGGRGSSSDVVVYRVTNFMNNATGTVSGNKGSGSLRWALESSALNGKRLFIVFTKAGIFDLTKYDSSGNAIQTVPIQLSRPYVTIAGQTAPGGGICLKNAGLRIKAHDVVIRGMRFRPGGHHFSGTANLKEDARDCLSFDQSGIKVENIVVDHCSFAWSTDEQVQFYVYGGDGDAFSQLPIENVTLSNCLFTEPLDSPWHLVYDNGDKHHAYQLSVDYVRNMTLYRNLFVHGQRRQPEVRAGSEVEIINNLVYNYEGVALEFFGNPTAPKPTKAIVVGNLFLVGPNSDYDPDNGGTKAINRGITFNAHWPPNTGSQFFLSGNFGHYRTSPTQNEWDEAAVQPGWTDVVNARKSEETDIDGFVTSGVSRIDASEVYDSLLGLEANSLDHSGAFPRDAVDARAISDVLTDSGGVPLYTRSLYPNGVNPGPQGETPGPLAKADGIPAGEPNWTDDNVSYRMQDEYSNKNLNFSDDWEWNNGDESARWQGYNIGSLPDTNADGVPNDWEDSDGDGIPNNWENNYSGGSGLEPVAVSGDGDGGYLNIEVYINSFIPPSGK